MSIMTEDEERRFDNKIMTQDELDIINAEIKAGIRTSGIKTMVKRLSDTVSVIGTEECVKDITLEDIQNLDVPHHLYRG